MRKARRPSATTEYIYIESCSGESWRPVRIARSPKNPVILLKIIESEIISTPVRRLIKTRKACVSLALFVATNLM